LIEQIDIGIFIARVFLSAVFLFSACDKWLHRADSLAELEALKLPYPLLLRPMVIALQLIAGLMVLLGFYARLGALALLGFTAIATLVGHRFWKEEGPNFRMQCTIALEHLAIVGGLLLLAVLGAGNLALDR